MVDITFAIEAKSDQLNAVDLISGDRVIKIRDVIVKNTTEQPVSVFFDGDKNKPWKPSKGMLRVMSKGWSPNSKNWIGKWCRIYCEPKVTYGGQESGGIRTNALSDIDKNGFVISLPISRTKREKFVVYYLEPPISMYPDENFQKALPTMIKLMTDGKKTLQQIIAQCQKTGQLSAEQIKQLEQAAPVVADCETEGKEQ